MTDYAVVLDLEIDLGGDRKDPSPYNKDNTFVALGYTLRSPHGYLLNGNTEVVILNVEDDEGARSSSGDSIMISVKEKPVNNPPISQIFSIGVSIQNFSTQFSRPSNEAQRCNPPRPCVAKYSFPTALPAIHRAIAPARPVHGCKASECDFIV